MNDNELKLKSIVHNLWNIPTVYRCIVAICQKLHMLNSIIWIQSKFHLLHIDWTKTNQVGFAPNDCLLRKVFCWIWTRKCRWLSARIIDSKKKLVELSELFPFVHVYSQQLKVMNAFSYWCQYIESKLVHLNIRVVAF